MMQASRLTRPMRASGLTGPIRASGLTGPLRATLLGLCLGLGGCGVVALPFRATSAVVKVVPVAGGVVAAPLDATADVID